ncbi:hypothetical protein BDZ89DRAFT_246982 [Hymenopellis radicata]|nr:hypothetical protein BDZ89DRAFT_246982 [Hymenopellis radicata]
MELIVGHVSDGGHGPSALVPPYVLDAGALIPRRFPRRAALPCLANPVSSRCWAALFARSVAGSTEQKTKKTRRMGRSCPKTD